MRLKPQIKAQIHLPIEPNGIGLGSPKRYFLSPESTTIATLPTKMIKSPRARRRHQNGINCSSLGFPIISYMAMSSP